MNRKTMPLILMLVAGAITCIITLTNTYTVLERLIALFIVLVVFYFLGSALKWTLDYFDRENEKKRQEEEEAEGESENLEEEQENPEV